VIALAAESARRPRCVRARLHPKDLIEFRSGALIISRSEPSVKFRFDVAAS
jgi:hypothetical protein